ncbi:MAG TPA: hypothetical protein VKR06_02035 [Ktedonosporobacter sp.]|nr:hypothetical protein [Ktedonosporobacter sp.]
MKPHFFSFFDDDMEDTVIDPELSKRGHFSFAFRQVEESDFDPNLASAGNAGGQEEQKGSRKDSKGMAESITPHYFNALGFASYQRFQTSNNPGDLKQAVREFEQAVNLCEPASEEWQQSLHHLAMTLMILFPHSEQMEYLNRAINLFGQLAEHKASNTTKQPAHLLHLYACLILRFGKQQKRADMDRAIRLGQEIIEYTTSQSPCRSKHLQNQVTALWMRYVLIGNPADQGEIIKTQALIIGELPSNSPDRLDWINGIATTMLTYYNEVKHPSEHTAMIHIGEQLVASTPADAPYLPLLFCLIAAGLMGRFSLTNNEDDLTQAVQQQEHALSLCKPGSPDQMQCSNNMGNALKMLYEKTHDLAYLDRAIGLIEQAIKLAPARHSILSAYRLTLADALEERFARTENFADLERAKKLRAKLKKY